MNSPNYVPHLARSYDNNAVRYRRDDEVEVRSENHQRLAEMLRMICRSFCRPLRVLEIGCGTGRYFYCLKNVQALVGVDISAEMLKLAEHPVFESEITVEQTRLVQGDVYTVQFPPASFDFVYSLGVFGYGAKWTQHLSDKVGGWLAPGGQLFFNAIETPHFQNRTEQLKHILRTNLYPKLPAGVRNLLASRQSVSIVQHVPTELREILERSGFTNIAIYSQACRSPLWKGIHLECLARKYGDHAISRPRRAPAAINT